MSDSLAGGFRIGDLTVQPKQGRIVSRAGEAHIEPRAMDVLVALARRAGDTVSRDELIEAVWKHPHVSDEALSRCISLLRQALGDDRSQPRYLETIPKRGYRLVARVQIAAANETLPGHHRIGSEGDRESTATTAPPNGATRGDHRLIVGSGSRETPDWSKTNLALQPTRIIGRESELAEVRSLLVSQRLVTLTGSAGVGKTRLAIEVGIQSACDFTDGVWLVELAPLSDATLVPATVSTVLGIELGHVQQPSRELARRIGDRNVLLILDNCEHLIDAAAVLAEAILGAAPNVRLLATSQVLVGIAGEQVYRVPSLSVPNEDRLAADEIMSAAAVQLFVERAKAADAHFHLQDESATAVAAICRSLDGIPLAIEMAGARAPLLGVEQLARLLDERFRVLTGGRRTALPRQQTLRATLDWSYRLLSVRERTVLARLGVFAGSFTPEAASAVASDETIDNAETIDTLARLVSRSLVVAFTNEFGQRYRLLQSTRDYALERLEESEQSATTRTRHLDFYLQLAEQRLPNAGGTEPGWLGPLHLERENFLVAHAWCDRAPSGGDSGLRLAYALKDYWVHRGGLEPGYRVTVEALARSDAQQRTLARCRALFTAALLATCMGRYAEVQGYREECLSIARELGDDRLVIFALLSLGEHFYVQRRWSEARFHIEEAVARARNWEGGKALNSALLPLADLNRIQGNLDAAERLYEEGLALAREFADRRNVIPYLVDLAMVAVARGANGRAPSMLLEALATCEEIGSKPLGSVVVLITSGVAASFEQWQRAAQLHGAAARQCEEIGYRCEPADEAFLAPLIERTRNALGDATLAAEEKAGRSLSYGDAMTSARAWLQEAAGLEARDERSA